MGALTGAEVALIEGRPDEVLTLAARAAGRPSDAPSQNQVRALDLIARAHLELGDLSAAAETAGRALPLAESMQFGAILWRLRTVHATALNEPIDHAEAEFKALAERIPEPELRWWFEHQPLAPR